MSRKRRQPSTTGFYHWIVRGIHKKDLFHRPADYEVFKKLLSEHKSPFFISIYHYCLMTNHVHLLISSPSLETMAKFSQLVQRRYAYYYCGAHHWTGNVFQRGYRSVPVEKDGHLLECARYIERNPLKTASAVSPGAYPYSSHRFYAEGSVDDLLERSPAYLGLADTEEGRMAIYTEYVNAERSQDELVAMGQQTF